MKATETNLPRLDFGLPPSPLMELSRMSEILGAGRRLFAKLLSPPAARGLAIDDIVCCGGTGATIVFLHTGGMVTLLSGMHA